MAALLRVSALSVVVSTLLVFASVASGHFADAAMRTGNLEVESRRYILYIEDPASGLRVSLAGARCFDGIPLDGTYLESGSVTASMPTYSKFFFEWVTVEDVLDQCH
jgi:hypothetical protein